MVRRSYYARGEMMSKIDRRSLLWGLDRLALWGELDGVENADPHVRGEAASSAKVTIGQIAWELDTNQNEVNASGE